MANLSRLAFVTSTIFFLGIQAKAQESAEDLKPVQNYQIQSQYGPDSAVLNPIFPKDSKIELSLGANYSREFRVERFIILIAVMRLSLFYFNITLVL